MENGISIDKSTDIQRQLNCFIIMPFSMVLFKDSEGIEQKLNEDELKYICDELFVKAVKSYNKNGISFSNVHRNETKRGNFVKEIVGKLQEYDLVIADLTGSNPNVFYELGIRHTLCNGTIMLTQNKSSLPSDLKNYIGFEYKFYKNAVDFSKYYSRFEEDLHSLIDDYLKDKDKVDNPVRDFIGDKQIFKKEDRINEIASNLEIMLRLKERYMTSVAAYAYMYKLKKITHSPSIANSISFLTQAFLNKIVGSNENRDIYLFIEHLISSTQFIEVNLENYKKNLIRLGLTEDQTKDEMRNSYLCFRITYNILRTYLSAVEKGPQSGRWDWLNEQKPCDRERAYYEYPREIG